MRACKYTSTNETLTREENWNKMICRDKYLQGCDLRFTGTWFKLLKFSKNILCLYITHCTLTTPYSNSPTSIITRSTVMYKAVERTNTGLLFSHASDTVG
jgi:hypothetical protein